MTHHTTTHRLLRTVGAAALGLAAAVGVASPALAHDELVATEVVADAQGGPEALQLTFNNSIVEVGTEFIVQSADGTDVTDGAAEVRGPSVTQPLVADLEPGNYSAAWRVVSSDGHPIEGVFALVVAADGSAEVTDAAPGQAAGETGTAGTADTENGGAASGAQTSSVPVGALIAVVVGGAAVIAGGITAATVGRKRRAQAMAADAPAASADADRSSDSEGGRA